MRLNARQYCFDVNKRLWPTFNAFNLQIFSVLIVGQAKQSGEAAPLSMAGLPNLA